MLRSQDQTLVLSYDPVSYRRLGHTELLGVRLVLPWSLVVLLPLGMRSHL